MFATNTADNARVCEGVLTWHIETAGTVGKIRDQWARIQAQLAEPSQGTRASLIAAARTKAELIALILRQHAVAPPPPFARSYQPHGGVDGPTRETPIFVHELLDMIPATPDTTQRERVLAQLIAGHPEYFENNPQVIPELLIRFRRAMNSQLVSDLLDLWRLEGPAANLVRQLLRRLSTITDNTRLDLYGGVLPDNPFGGVGDGSETVPLYLRSMLPLIDRALHGGRFQDLNALYRWVRALDHHLLRQKPLPTRSTELFIGEDYAQALATTFFNARPTAFAFARALIVDAATEVTSGHAVPLLDWIDQKLPMPAGAQGGSRSTRTGGRSRGDLAFLDAVPVSDRAAVYALVEHFHQWRSSWAANRLSRDSVVGGVLFAQYVLQQPNVAADLKALFVAASFGEASWYERVWPFVGEQPELAAALERTTLIPLMVRAARLVASKIPEADGNLILELVEWERTRASGNGAFPPVDDPVRIQAITDWFVRYSFLGQAPESYVLRRPSRLAPDAVGGLMLAPLTTVQMRLVDAAARALELQPGHLLDRHLYGRGLWWGGDTNSGNMALFSDARAAQVWLRRLDRVLRHPSLQPSAGIDGTDGTTTRVHRARVLTAQEQQQLLYHGGWLAGPAGAGSRTPITQSPARLPWHVRHPQAETNAWYGARPYVTRALGERPYYNMNAGRRALHGFIAPDAGGFYFTVALPPTWVATTDRVSGVTSLALRPYGGLDGGASAFVVPPHPDSDRVGGGSNEFIPQESDGSLRLVFE